MLGGRIPKNPLERRSALLRVTRRAKKISLLEGVSTGSGASTGSSPIESGQIESERREREQERKINPELRGSTVLARRQGSENNAKKHRE